VTLALYRALWWIALPLAALRLAFRALRDTSYRSHWRERLARQLPAGPFDYWIHAVSVGETRAAEPLIRAIHATQPSARVLLTHMTPTGRASGAALFRESVTQCYLPYDFAHFATRFIACVRPRVGVIMETELWPNVIDSAHAQGVPMWLVNARLSERSARGYARVPRLSKQMLTGLTGVLAQAPADAQRFRDLGALRVEMLGNMKFDVSVPADTPARAVTLRVALGEGPLWVAGSTREGDEQRVLDALRAHPLRSTARCVIVPRHPQRFDEVFALATAMGYRTARRSAPAADAEVVIGDSMGEMAAYFACADVVLMGGSFATGSQNLIEPCAAGKPVVLGPSVYNFAAAADAALACGAALQVATAEQALDAVAGLLADPARRRIMGDAGLAFCAQNRGATARTLAFVQKNQKE
jgi:3-deoxy-D-manno-octulosonic-acid transferase